MSKCLKLLKATKQKQRESDVSKKYLGGELEKVFEGTDIKNNNSVFLDAQKNKPFISEKKQKSVSTQVLLQDYSLLHYFHSYQQLKPIPPSVKELRTNYMQIEC